MDGSIQLTLVNSILLYISLWILKEWVVFGLVRAVGNPCKYCNHRDVNNLVIIDHVCEICINRATSTSRSPPGPKFGEYRCTNCRRYWNSRWCWPDKYQMCKQCKTPILPYNYRDLKPTDTIKYNNDDGQDHVRELCQMCLQLGYSCKSFGKKHKPPVPSSSRTTKMYKSTYSYYKKW